MCVIEDVSADTDLWKTKNKYGRIKAQGKRFPAGRNRLPEERKRLKLFVERDHEQKGERSIYKLQHEGQ